MLKQQHQLFAFLLVCADAFVMGVAALAAWLGRELFLKYTATNPGHLPSFIQPGANYRHWWPTSWEQYIKEPLVVFIIPLGLMSLWCFKLYRPRRDRSLVAEARQLALASLVAVASLVVVLWAIGNDAITSGPMGSAIPTLPYIPGDFVPPVVFGRTVDVGRVQLLMLAAILPVALIAHRASFRIGLRILRRHGWNQRHVAIIGVGRIGRIVHQTLARNSWTGIQVAYFISHQDENTRTECNGRPVLGGLRDLEHTLERCPVDAVYLALPNRCAAQLSRIQQRLERFPIDVRIVPDVNPRYLPQSMVLHELDGMPILSYRESPMNGIPGVIKRGMDIVGALIGIILFSPVMIAAAIAVRLSGPGPIIFRQPRVSIGGQRFEIYKFRTMHQVNAEREPTSWTLRDDPRVTRVGRFLRKTSIDELPQLFNVLIGDMSLVGPRPEMASLIARHREDWRGYMLRQHVKAGMTGWAQINGLRGNTSLRRRLRYDLYYIRNWSLWFDLKILLLTPWRGFVHRNAH